MRAKVKKSAKVKILHEGKFIRFVRKGEWEYFQRNNCSDIVIIVATTKNDEVVFVEQFRPPVNKLVIEFPAGLVNDLNDKRRETILTAAKRELLEETGFQAKGIKKILVGPVSAGSSADLVTMVRALNAVKVADGGGDEFENIKIHVIALSKVDRWLKQMAQKGRLIEPKIYTGLYYIKNYNNGFVRKKD